EDGIRDPLVTGVQTCALPILAFIISLWFIHSFDKGIRPKIISFAVLAFVALFLYKILEFDPAKLKSHFESYTLKVIFYGKNFKRSEERRVGKECICRIVTECS